MELTARHALEITLELWTWLEDNPGGAKTAWPGWKKYWEMTSECPLCEYFEQRRPIGKCCLVYWRRKPGLDNHCLDYDSPYKKWGNVSSVRSKRFYAGKIVKLCEEALERLEE